MSVTDNLKIKPQHEYYQGFQLKFTIVHALYSVFVYNKIVVFIFAVRTNRKAV